ncbi:hypothetical protein E6H16_00700 [Candidatus Bathyarchaeota archaeon]|nr:MAG: hypothetical protein E6H16_00700 [Candidatus Bathyarchaeota archaeon]
MSRFPASVSLVALALLLLGCYSSIASGASGSGTQPNHGFVAYQISLTKAGNAVEVFVVNETGQPTDQNDLVQLTFALTSGKRHLTYSKVVNSSSLPEIFPYFPELNNQSLSYSSHGIKLSAQISRSGTAQVTFKGQTYTAVKHALSISVSRTNGETYSAAGNILTMPSGLVYSVELQAIGPYALTATLVATNLPLTNPSGTTTMFGFALVGLGLVGAVGLAVPSVFALVRAKTATRNTLSIAAEPSKAQSKPSHWVD